LLVLDARTNELQAVRELAGDAAQTTARDLWRLEAHEAVATMPTALPRWDSRPQRSADVVDPACPELERSKVISVRRMAAMRGMYGDTYVPTPLPSNVTHAAFISPALAASNGVHDVSGAQLVFRSGTGWLRISNARTSLSGLSASQPHDVQYGRWTIRFTEASGATDSLSATMWEQQPEDASLNTWYGPLFSVEAVGWTRDQLLETVKRLQPLDEQTWPTVASHFLDPHPLPADIAQVVGGAQHTLDTLPDGPIYIMMDVTAHTAPQQPARFDPYHVPLSVTTPHAWMVEQWATIHEGVPLYVEHGFTDPSIDDLAAKRLIVKAACDVIVLADHIKFGRIYTGRIAPINAAHTIVSDAGVPDQIVHDIAAQGPRVLLAPLAAPGAAFS
jgi:hypothetical protein